MNKSDKRLAREFGKNRNRTVFYRYLTRYGWTRDQVDEMWEYTQKRKDKRNG